MEKTEIRKPEVTFYESPIGLLFIKASTEGITEIAFPRGSTNKEERGSSAILDECVSQLDEYFHGKRATFDIPLDLKGTPFQISVWRALLLIPCGNTWSYGKVALQIGRSKASRAIGSANHRNPVPIIVPCHRVIGSDGKLVGYGGGLWRKEWLLEHEREIARQNAG